MRAFIVTYGHFQSRDKDGGYTIRSTVTENPKPQFIEPELLPIEVLHCGNRDFGPCLLLCDFDLDPMTFTYELDPYSLEIYRL